MANIFSIELPTSVSDSDIETLKTEIKELENVTNAGLEDARSGIDPVSLGIWVQTVTGILGLIGTAVPIIQKIIEMLRGKGIKGAKISLANGVVINVDEVSVKELERLLRAAQP